MLPAHASSLLYVKGPAGPEVKEVPATSSASHLALDPSLKSE